MDDGVTKNANGEPLPWEEEQSDLIPVCPRCGTLHSGTNHPLRAMKNRLLLWAKEKKANPYDLSDNSGYSLMKSLLDGGEETGSQTTDVRP